MIETTASTRRRRLFLLAGLLLALVILAASALPTATKHALHTQGAWHPWLHLLAFGGLALLLLSSTRSDLLRAILVITLLCFGYATEAGEGRRNGWGVELADVRSDCIGVLGGGVLSLLLFPKNRV